MNSRYTLTQQKLYQDYSVKSTEQLFEIIKEKDKYNDNVIEIVNDIINERNNTLTGDNNINNEEQEDDIVGRINEEYKRAEAKDNMIYGAAIGGLGILITTITYFLSSNGGVYIIAWGAILVGVYRFFKGLTIYIK
jgi:hypothetical protein